MIRNINNYLLIYYPLLWNTRVLWVLAANILFYLLFFLAGYSTLDLGDLISHYSVWQTGAAVMVTFSFLCSLLVLILWLVWFLRNNAFKNFYRIDHFHLAREFLLIFLILLSSSLYFEAFHYGIKIRMRQYTSQSEFVAELNTLNRASQFIPQEKAPYFIFNSCDGKASGLPQYNESTDYIKTEGVDYDQSDSSVRQIREALRRDDAFSYRNYCVAEYPSYFYGGLLKSEELSAKNAVLINHRRQDSILQLLIDFERLCKKYHVDVKLDKAALSAAPLATQNALMKTALIPGLQSDYNGGATRYNQFYLESSDLRRVVSFVDECQPNSANQSEDLQRLLVEGYTALCATLLLLAYRRFSRKVFLVSIVGAIVWSMLIGLIAATMHFDEDGFLMFVIFLSLAFGVAAFVGLRSQGHKTATGALVVWHFSLAPFLVMMLIACIESYLNQKRERTFEGDKEAWLRLHYPTLTWITGHTLLLYSINFFLMIIYIAFVYNRAARKWQASPQE